MLLPMYFLIGIWGAPPRVEEGGRVRGGPYAAIKFFLYTLAGSVLMLLAMIALYFTSGPAKLVDGTLTQHTFNLVYLTQMSHQGLFANAAPILGFAFSKVIFIALFIGFAIKVPMFPFHTWLPDAHVDAPTPISVILAGILLKMGMYGMFRFNLQMLRAMRCSGRPGGSALFGVINIVYGAFVCMAQKDLKKLIAYSSVSPHGLLPARHGGAHTAGHRRLRSSRCSRTGSSQPMLFLIAGVIYDRAHTREINGFGGLAARLPEYAGLTGLAFMASLGLPGLAGFIGEVLVFIGALRRAERRVPRPLVAIGALAVVITAGYYLWTMQRMFLGPLNEKWDHLWDMNWRERSRSIRSPRSPILLGFYPGAGLQPRSTRLAALRCCRRVRGAVRRRCARRMTMDVGASPGSRPRSRSPRPSSRSCSRTCSGGITPRAAGILVDAGDRSAWSRRRSSSRCCRPERRADLRRA